MTEFVHISEIRRGDTVIHDGKAMTVGKKDIRYSYFFGESLFGDSYNLGQKLVEVMLFPKWFRGEIIGYRRQI